MKILDVIPIARGISKEVLSYFSVLGAPRGSIVFVPLRNREVPGIVLHERDAEELRTEVRNLNFEIKKANTRKVIPLFSAALMSAAEKTASFYATTTGAILSAILPVKILETIKSIKLPEHRWETKVTRSRTLADVLVFQAEEEERISRYRSIIRECFARNESVHLIVPTLIDALRLYERLGRGIEDFIFLFHSSLSQKEIAAGFKHALNGPHPILIISTPAFICVERPDVHTIIIERENSAAYKVTSRPYLDFRYLIEQYAQARGIRLILGGLPLRIETLARFDAHEISELTTPAFRLLRGAPSEIIDMRRKETSSNSFEILGLELRKSLEAALKGGDNTLLYVARRGLAPLTICQDCGSVVKSSDGETPMVLHSGPRGNIFVSHVTGEMHDAHERCHNCKSWRLQELGIGSERVEQEVRRLFPSARVLKIDHESARTPKQVQDMVRRFYATPGSILITTERSLTYLGEKIAYSAVVSIDSLLALPEWKISERIFSILLKLREITTKKYLIQTRNASAPLLKLALDGNIADFMRNEISLRKSLRYPPFTVLIKLSVAGSLERVSDAMRNLLDTFESYGLEPYPAPLSIGRSRYVFHALMRIPSDSWPHEELLMKFSALPPHIALDINPESLH